MNTTPRTTALGKVTLKVAGHIEKPYSAEELAAMIESGDYSAELVMQHLLLLICADGIDRINYGKPLTTSHHAPMNDQYNTRETIVNECEATRRNRDDEPSDTCH